MNKDKIWLLMLAALIPVSYVLLVYMLPVLNIDVNPPLLFFLSFLTSLILLVSDSGKPSADENQRKRIQQEKSVPKDMLRDLPQQNEDIILGKTKGKYVCTRTNSDGHWMIIGGTGSGKSSSAILPALLNNQNTAAIIVDCKDHELYHKSCRTGDEHVEVFDPEQYDGSTWGFNPFYQLDENSSDYDVLNAVLIIAGSIVPIPADVKDPFWKQNARNLFIGLSLHYYINERCHTLVDIVDRILDQPVEEQVKQVLDQTTPGSIARKYLIMFSSMENETLYGIFAELTSNLTIFNHPGIRYAFGQESRRKISPLDLEHRKRVYLCIDMSTLSTMNSILRLILDVMIYGLETRTREKEEKDLDPILFIIDEFPTVISGGGLSQFLVGVRVLRSAKVHFWIVTQNIPSLIGPYSKDEVADIISNMNLMVLSSNNPETTHMLTELVGTFKAQDKSFSGKGHRKTTISFRDEDVIKASDISTLPEKGKELIVTCTGWMVIDKCPYYKDRYLSSIASDIARYNQTIEDMQNTASQTEKITDKAKIDAVGSTASMQKQIEMLLRQQERK